MKKKISTIAFLAVLLSCALVSTRGNVRIEDTREPDGPCSPVSHTYYWDLFGTGDGWDFCGGYGLAPYVFWDSGSETVNTCPGNVVIIDDYPYYSMYPIDLWLCQWNIEVGYVTVHD